MKLTLFHIFTKLIPLKENDAVKNNSQKTAICRNPSIYNIEGHKN